MTRHHLNAMALPSGIENSSAGTWKTATIYDVTQWWCWVSHRIIFLFFFISLFFFSADLRSLLTQFRFIDSWVSNVQNIPLALSDTVFCEIVFQVHSEGQSLTDHIGADFLTAISSELSVQGANSSQKSRESLLGVISVTFIALSSDGLLFPSVPLIYEYSHWQCHNTCAARVNRAPDTEVSLRSLLWLQRDCEQLLPLRT
jgi:hypothetical protein